MTRWPIPFLLLLTAAAPAPSDSITARYQHAEQVLRESRAQEAATAAERDRLAAEARALAQRLVVNAARVQTLEEQLAVSDQELGRLTEQSNALQADLATRREKVARLLAVLQRLDNDEPPALALRPDDSLAAARGAMVFGSMLPPVYGEAHALAVQLRKLLANRAAIERNRARARQEENALKAARATLAALEEQRSREAQKANARVGELHAVTQDIAHQATGLKSLIDRIAAVRAHPDPNQGMVVVTAANTGDDALKPGSIRKPVVGTMAVGDPSGPKGGANTPGQGVWFEGKGDAPVVAPADSEVVFAGPYQKFGNVLILEMAQGYHLLLARMGRIDVRIGDRMLAGEPVGVLAQGRTARLYMELRRGGETLNVAAWMSAELRRGRGS